MMMHACAWCNGDLWKLGLQMSVWFLDFTWYNKNKCYLVTASFNAGTFSLGTTQGQLLVETRLLILKGLFLQTSESGVFNFSAKKKNRKTVTSGLFGQRFMMDFSDMDSGSVRVISIKWRSFLRVSRVGIWQPSCCVGSDLRDKMTRVDEKPPLNP